MKMSLCATLILASLVLASASARADTGDTSSTSDTTTQSQQTTAAPVPLTQQERALLMMGVPPQHPVVPDTSPLSQ